MDLPAKMLCGDLARLCGVSADTVRHYERIGILAQTPRSQSGYRLFSRDAVGRIRLAQHALALGFTLTELAELLQTHDRGSAPCARVLALAERKLCLINQQIRDLHTTQKNMNKLIRSWRGQLARTPDGDKALLLHSLVNSPPSPSTRRILSRSRTI
jgi:DNA-binding transcriptional MerR regulator